ncbi:30S ribosomal protein S16 [Candidatus Saccharibacteria bacterium]|nr:30S ribosomal protein S16 [Candidatus Saccharibacteria bacterium]
MVVIRLSRVGRNKYALYRIVAADKRRAATGKFLAVLGTYNPHTKEVKLDKDEIAKYLQNGAQASDRVLRILKANGVDLPKWAGIHDRNKKSKKSEEKKDEAVAKPENPPAGGEAEVAEATQENAEAKAATVDAPETAATEEKVVEDVKKATEDVADAAAKADKEAKA